MSLIVTRSGTRDGENGLVLSWFLSLKLWFRAVDTHKNEQNVWEKRWVCRKKGVKHVCCHVRCVGKETGVSYVFVLAMGGGLTAQNERMLWFFFWSVQHGQLGCRCALYRYYVGCGRKEVILSRSLFLAIEDGWEKWNYWQGGYFSFSLKALLVDCRRRHMVQ